ncbi:19295_t:CDS:10 [Entrophospora sp. SA101]|nr:19295_t:CDS:10 [Entrophospora sp. SA101]
MASASTLLTTSFIKNTSGLMFSGSHNYRLIQVNHKKFALARTDLQISSEMLGSLINGVKSAIGSIGGLTNMNVGIEIPGFVKNMFSKNPTQSKSSSNSFKADSDRPKFIKKEDEGDSESSSGGNSEKDNDENDGEDSGAHKNKRGIPAQDDEFMVLKKKLIEVCNILMSIDHKEALKLPSIVVISSQSSGKSSVLEAIVANINTYKEEYGEFPQLGLGKIHDFLHIQQTLHDLNLAAPESEYLPGYIQVTNKNQPETLKEKIVELCEQYIREPNIILAVCSADIYLANSEALKAIEPEIGASILRNTDYPLHLGYIGIQIGTGTLCRKLMEVLEENMAKSLFSIVSAVQSELEEARYQFKVQYNDRRMTAESYVAETIDSIKHNFKDFAHSFGKPQVRNEVRAMLEQRVLDLCAEGSNMVTRRPIELTLIHTSKSKEEYGEFPQLGLGKIHDFLHIQQTLRDLNLAVPESECVSNKPIELRIYSPNVPDLTLIDLPGYIQVTNKNQPETLKEKIVELCEQYIREPNIILAVCSADVDLANSEALKASRKVDSLGLRTIGVITKMDLVEPEIGASILRNTDYPLHLGYIVLEENMAKSLFSIVSAVQSELEEARYQFKVQYNDRRMTAESYVAETIDSIKHNFKDFAHSFGKPQVRNEVRAMLEQRVLDLCAELYWTDKRIVDLPKTPPDDLYWQYKLDMSSATLTKSGIGRTSTQLVVDVLMANMEKLASMEPLNHHPDTSKKVLNFSNEILRNKFPTTADQVENCVKPYKYEVECNEQEWAEGLKRSILLVEKELEYCDTVLQQIKNTEVIKKLRAAIKYILDGEKEAAKRANVKAKESSVTEINEEVTIIHNIPSASNKVIEENDYDNHRLHFNAKLLEKAREAIFLRDRSMILKYRLAALKSRQCKLPENKQFCPEAFLNVVAEKLTYTAVMFIQVELLNEFFFQFPREVDNRLIYDLDRKQILSFAKENPYICKHLELQERKRKLEEVMEKLNYLVRRQRDIEGRKSPT